MKQGQSSTPSWKTILLLLLGVMAVVIIALLLAQIDTYQRRSAVPSDEAPIIDLDATVAAGELATVYLPSEASPTSTPPTTPTKSEPKSDEITPDAPTPQLESGCNGAMEDYSTYNVEPGDSLTSIASQFGLSEDALRQANCLTHDLLIEGQQIYLSQATAGDPLFTQCDVPPNWKSYIVKQHDTLPKLAHEHGTNPYHIMKVNCLEYVQLLVGTEIFLPDISQGSAKPNGG